VMCYTAQYLHNIVLLCDSDSFALLSQHNSSLECWASTKAL
jgi:hypothetical protein